MSRNLGYFADEGPQDFPHLNKCPECETFFESLTCPLCGKVCPEEMRAGNRKPIKSKKSHKSGWQTRPAYVPWYLSTWFIIAMCIVQPVVGLVLTWMGYWKKGWKIAVTVLLLLPYFSGVLTYVLSFLLRH